LYTCNPHQTVILPALFLLINYKSRLSGDNILKVAVNQSVEIHLLSITHLSFLPFFKDSRSLSKEVIHFPYLVDGSHKLLTKKDMYSFIRKSIKAFYVRDGIYNC